VLEDGGLGGVNSIDGGGGPHCVVVAWGGGGCCEHGNTAPYSVKSCNMLPSCATVNFSRSTLN
jgi:hypothetical protein